MAGSPYSITPSNAIGSGVSNYTITYDPGMLNITKAPLTVIADNKSKFYGDNDPALTCTASGPFYNGDTSAVVTGVTLATTTGAAATAGTHTITTTGGTAANYSITDLNGTLTVYEAPLTITAADANKVYGATDPNLSFTTTGTLYYGDAITSVNLTSAGTAGTATVAGSPYAIVPGNAIGSGLSNYAISYNDRGTLDVTPAPLSITAASTNKVYGATDANMTYSTTGTLFNGDSITGVTLSTRNGRDGDRGRLALRHRAQ